VRFPDWPALLNAEIDAARTRAFAWGSHDCLQFAAACVYAMTGVDHAGPFGTYSTEEEAEALLEAHGEIEGLLTELLGPSVPPMLACEGDVVVTPASSLIGAGICTGQQAVFAAPFGVAFRPRSEILAAWKVY
jgi:hypothetical protein